MISATEGSRAEVCGKQVGGVDEDNTTGGDGEPRREQGYEPQTGALSQSFVASRKFSGFVPGFQSLPTGLLWASLTRVINYGRLQRRLAGLAQPSATRPGVDGRIGWLVGLDSATIARMMSIDGESKGVSAP